MDWLEKLKPGDSVIVSGRDTDTMTRVEHVTKTQIVVNGTRYRKTDGTRIGQHNIWHVVCLVEPTPARVESMREQQRMRRLDKMRRVLADYAFWKKLSDETVLQVWAATHSPTREAEETQDGNEQ